jgi:hypothetical protein
VHAQSLVAVHFTELQAYDAPVLGRQLQGKETRRKQQLKYEQWRAAGQHKLEMPPLTFFVILHTHM